jgi:predicted DNA-binding transcriptional regulator AlpA
MDTQKLAMSIPEFSKLHSISRTTFYNLLQEGRAPNTMKVGRRRFISAEAAASWRQRMERAEPGSFR